MTREEAIKVLKRYKSPYTNCAADAEANEAIDKAISALSQEPSGDLISKQEVLYLVADYDLSMGQVVRGIHALPSVKQEPSGEIVKTEESNDNGTKYLNINVSDDEVKRNPDIVRLFSDVGMLEYMKPKTGHWIKSNIPNEKYVCSECGGACWYYDYQGDVAKSRYCPNCGARMVEQKESEDKDGGV